MTEQVIIIIVCNNVIMLEKQEEASLKLSVLVSGVCGDLL